MGNVVLPIFNKDPVLAATCNFSKAAVVGKGSFGIVYQVRRKRKRRSRRSGGATRRQAHIPKGLTVPNSTVSRAPGNPKGRCRWSPARLTEHLRSRALY
eukprot:9207234-Pyramimonas_sp.AAC.1